tara:strand:- start:1117 stop:2100 length:984 start_codon:yes stop_codon:yes gene_type:complete
VKKLAILFTSRNNYDLLDKWLSEVDWNGFEVLNIDEDSEHLEVQKGKSICKKHNITYMDRDKRGLLNNITTAMEYYQDSDVDWVIWFQHDCFPLTPNFFDRVNKVMSAGDLDDFGCVGFNTFHKVNGLYEKGDRSLHYVARAPLEPGDNWYRNHKQWSNTRVRLQTDSFKKPFSVEIPAAFCVALNLTMWGKYITPIDDYHFMNVFDEIGFQYLNQNIHNVVLPYLHIGHEPERKIEINIPKVSSKAHKANQRGKYVKEHFDHDDKYFGKWGLSVFENRWGVDYDNARPSFEKVKDRYEGTLLIDFYNHDPIKGPLKSFDIEYEEDR